MIKGLEETQEYLDLYSKKLHYTISTLEKDFKRSHKRVSYNKAKELYEKSTLKSKYKKLTEKQKKAINDALELDN